MMGYYNHIMGYYNPTMGYYNPMMGYHNPTMGYCDHMMGYYNPTMGYYNLRMGYYNPTMGYCDRIHQSHGGILQCEHIIFTDCLRLSSRPVASGTPAQERGVQKLSELEVLDPASTSGTSG